MLLTAALVSDLEIEYFGRICSFDTTVVRALALYKYTCAVRSRFLPTLCAIRATSKRVGRGATTPRPTTPGVARNARLVVSLSLSLATNTSGTVKQRRYTLYQNLLRHRHRLRSYGFLEKRREYYLYEYFIHIDYHFSTAITWEKYVRRTYILITYVMQRIYIYNLYNFKLLNL